ncbi:MAG: sugar ABC transporter ATP-binding protein [Clostridiales bacterium]
MNPVLKLENINKKISDFFSLRDINLEFFKGEAHVLIGENASGKTSLMKIIAGFYLKDNGKIYIDNKEVKINSPADSKKIGISMIHQDFSLFDHFSIAENIFLESKKYSILSLKIIDFESMCSECDNLFAKFNIKLDSKTKVKKLSFAQKQLVEVAKAYVNKPKIIIMDEPSSSLTINESKILFNIIKELKKLNSVIIFISHRIEDLNAIGDRISILREGKIIFSSATLNLSEDKIINLMTGMDYSKRYPKLNIQHGREILRVKDLTSGKTFKNLNFNLYKKEILGITGLAGSGKSKLARCIFGIDKIKSGKIYLDNKFVNIKNTIDSIDNKIGYLSEDKYKDGLFLYLNIPLNITAPNLKRISNGYFIDKSFEKELTNTYTKKLDIKYANLYDNISQLSGGNQQKIALAKWIISRSKILILDEPTIGIDIASKVDIYNIINELVTKGSSIILISSDINEIIGMCDRVLVLYEGEISKTLTRENLSRDKIIKYMVKLGDNNL